MLVFVGKRVLPMTEPPGHILLQLFVWFYLLPVFIQFYQVTVKIAYIGRSRAQFALIPLLCVRLLQPAFPLIPSNLLLQFD